MDSAHDHAIGDSVLGHLLALHLRATREHIHFTRHTRLCHIRMPTSRRANLKSAAVELQCLAVI